MTIYIELKWNKDDTDAANGGGNEMEIDDENMADEMVISSSFDVNSGMIFLLCRLYI